MNNFSRNQTLLQYFLNPRRAMVINDITSLNGGREIIQNHIFSWIICTVPVSVSLVFSTELSIF